MKNRVTKFGRVWNIRAIFDAWQRTDKFLKIRADIFLVWASWCVCPALYRDVSEIFRASLKTVWFALQSHTSFANSYISCISSILAEEMDLKMSENSSVILRHILMRSFDAAYRVDGKSFRVFSLRCVPRSSAAGRLCTFKVVPDFYISFSTNPAFAASILWRQLPCETETCFSRFTIRLHDQIFIPSFRR